MNSTQETINEVLSLIPPDTRDDVMEVSDDMIVDWSVEDSPTFRRVPPPLPRG